MCCRRKTCSRFICGTSDLHTWRMTSMTRWLYLLLPLTADIMTVNVESCRPIINRLIVVVILFFFLFTCYDFAYCRLFIVFSACSRVLFRVLFACLNCGVWIVKFVLRNGRCLSAQGCHTVWNEVSPISISTRVLSIKTVTVVTFAV